MSSWREVLVDAVHMCFADPLTAQATPPGVLALDVAPGEVLFIAQAHDRSALAEHVQALSRAGTYCLPASGAWRAYQLDDVAARERVLSRLNARWPQDERLVQAPIAGIPAKTTIAGERTVILVESTLGHAFTAVLHELLGPPAPAPTEPDVAPVASAPTATP